MFYIDPVCKKKLHRKEEYAIIKYGGDTYHLCCKACKEEFQRSPIKYIPEGPTMADTKDDTIAGKKSAH